MIKSRFLGFRWFESARLFHYLSLLTHEHASREDHGLCAQTVADENCDAAVNEDRRSIDASPPCRRIVGILHGKHVHDA